MNQDPRLNQTRRSRTESVEKNYGHLLVPSVTGKIRRPPNAFMLFARDHRKNLSRDHPEKTNKSISTLLGQAWRKAGAEEKERYYFLANKLDDLHKIMYPGYSYNPKEARIQKQKKLSMRETHGGARRSTANQLRDRDSTSTSNDSKQQYDTSCIKTEKCSDDEDGDDDDSECDGLNYVPPFRRDYRDFTDHNEGYRRRSDEYISQEAKPPFILMGGMDCIPKPPLLEQPSTSANVQQPSGREEKTYATLETVPSRTPYHHGPRWPMHEHHGPWYGTPRPADSYANIHHSMNHPMFPPRPQHHSGQGSPHMYCEYNGVKHLPMRPDNNNAEYVHSPHHHPQYPYPPPIYDDYLPPMMPHPYDGHESSRGPPTFGYHHGRPYHPHMRSPPEYGHPLHPGYGPWQYDPYGSPSFYNHPNLNNSKQPSSRSNESKPEIPATTTATRSDNVQSEEVKSSDVNVTDDIDISEFTEPISGISPKLS